MFRICWISMLNSQSSLIIYTKHLYYNIVFIYRQIWLSNQAFITSEKLLSKHKHKVHHFHEPVFNLLKLSNSNLLALQSSDNWLLTGKIYGPARQTWRTWLQLLPICLARRLRDLIQLYTDIKTLVTNLPNPSSSQIN